jgi:hypothetical protein
MEALKQSVAHAQQGKDKAAPKKKSTAGRKKAAAR